MPVVALVCSAGGLAALEAVLTPLPPDFPAAVVVLQHIDPARARGTTRDHVAPVQQIPDLLTRLVGADREQSARTADAS